MSTRAVPVAENENQAAFRLWLAIEGFEGVRFVDGERWYAVRPLLYTVAIFAGRIGDTVSTKERWCYHTRDDALAALAAWDGTGEPQGWHRHSTSGRRRAGGDPAAEEVWS